MLAEIVLRLPSSESHRELLRKKIEYYGLRIIDEMDSVESIGEKKTVLPGQEVQPDLTLEPIIYATLAREILEHLFAEDRDFDKNKVSELTSHFLILEALQVGGYTEIESEQILTRLLNRAISNLYLYIAYENTLASSFRKYRQRLVMEDLSKS